MLTLDILNNYKEYIPLLLIVIVLFNWHKIQGSAYLKQRKINQLIDILDSRHTNNNLKKLLQNNLDNKNFALAFNMPAKGEQLAQEIITACTDSEGRLKPKDFRWIWILGDIKKDKEGNLIITRNINHFQRKHLGWIYGIITILVSGFFLIESPSFLDVILSAIYFVMGILIIILLPKLFEKTSKVQSELKRQIHAK